MRRHRVVALVGLVIPCQLTPLARLMLATHFGRLAFPIRRTTRLACPAGLAIATAATWAAVPSAADVPPRLRRGTQQLPRGSESPLELSDLAQQRSALPHQPPLQLQDRNPPGLLTAGADNP